LRIPKQYKYPLFKAKIMGLRDFILRRLGNCPVDVRHLHNKYIQNNQKIR
jgi:hypothetical protein